MESSASKCIVQFLNELCEIPLNNKNMNAKIPRIIKNSDNNIKYAFLRGLIDTDFCLTFQNKTGKGHCYPVIKGGFKSRKLVEDLEYIFKELGFSHSTYYDEVSYDKRFGNTTRHNIFLYGRKNLNKWVVKIGFSNNKLVMSD